MMLRLEQKGCWTSLQSIAQPVIHITGWDGNGAYYNLQATVNSQGWLVEVAKNGKNKGSFQGSTFNLEIECYAAVEKLG